MNVALAVGVGIGCAYWLAVLVLAIVTIRRVAVLADLAPREPSRWPKLSIIVPARDEAATLEPAMAGKLAQTGPEIELVLVDDRSTDGTGAIVDRIAAADPRVRALHVTALPDGWLGKVHALQRGLEASTGELVLFTDADVDFAPGLLARAVALMEQDRLDHLTTLPEFRGGSFLVDATVIVALRVICLGARAWKVDDPKSSAFGGAGAFNLVRRAALDRTPGLEWLRLEVADDVGLGFMMKRHGAKARVVLGRGLLAVRWYSTLSGYAAGMARAAFGSIAACSALRLSAISLLLFALESSPFWALGLVGHPELQAAGLATTAVALAAAVLVARALRQPLGAALALPLGIVLQLGVGLRGALLGALRGGVVWRDTFYSSAALRAGRRIEFL